MELVPSIFDSIVPYRYYAWYENKFKDKVAENIYISTKKHSDIIFHVCEHYNTENNKTEDKIKELRKNKVTDDVVWKKVYDKQDKLFADWKEIIIKIMF